ncbi:MAG: hypothetical protein WBZ28_14940, partial [Pseudolabrys sp.]
RQQEGATVKAESLTNDPTMINRLRAGETNVWDLINVNNPWARKVMWPAKLIKPLPRDQFEPYFAKMLSDFRAPYKWAMFVGVPIDRTDRIVSRPGTFLQSSSSRRRRGVCHR